LPEVKQIIKQTSKLNIYYMVKNTDSLSFEIRKIFRHDQYIVIGIKNDIEKPVIFSGKIVKQKDLIECRDQQFIKVVNEFDSDPTGQQIRNCIRDGADYLVIKLPTPTVEGVRILLDQILAAEKEVFVNKFTE